MKFSDNFKENLIHISILNLIFLKIWVFLEFLISLKTILVWGY